MRSWGVNRFLRFSGARAISPGLILRKGLWEVPTMILAGAFAIVLFLGLIVGDWMYFARLSSDASRYGYGIGQLHDRFPALTVPKLPPRPRGSFDPRTGASTGNRSDRTCRISSSVPWLSILQIPTFFTSAGRMACSRQSMAGKPGHLTTRDSPP